VKSPCRDCHNEFEDKNNATCLNCEARLRYVDSIGKCPSSSMAMEVVREENGKEEITMDKEKMKICRHKDCPFGGKPQPLDDFDNNNSAKDGKSWNCKACRRRMQTEHRARKKAVKKEQKIKEKPMDDGQGAIPKNKAETGGNILTIDFAGYEQVLNKIADIARDELRTPEMQVLYWLKEFSLIAEKGTGE